MALINCPNCNSLVSNKAVKCPHCGIELTPVESAQEEINPQLADVESVSDVESKSVVETYDESSHLLKYLLIGFVLSLIIGGGVLIFVNSGHSSSGLDIDKILEDVDRDMVAKNNEDSIEKQNVEKRLEEFKKFRTIDLSVFLLHGHVKKVTYSDDRLVCFDSDGKISYYKDCNVENMSNMGLTYTGHGLRFSDGPGASVEFTVDSQKRLTTESITMGNSYGSEKKYSGYDSNGWPTKWVSEEIVEEREDGEEDLCMAEIRKMRTTTVTIKYSGIDEYGNWTIKTEKNNDGVITAIRRSIEYYE